MMTGIEVAGIVLAVLPLFISALENYENGLDPIRAFLEFDSELPNQIRKLRDQHINYNLTMKGLLLSIADSEDVEEMISDPGGVRWKDSVMQKRLEERLDESYQAYLDTIKHIEEIMKTIAKDLKIDQSDRTTRADLQSLLIKAPRKDNHFEFGRRVKFGMKLKKFTRLLDELDSENRKLERFADKTERLETYRALSIPLPGKQSEEKPAEDVPDNEATSLNKLLMPDPDHYGHTLSRKDRMSLALILASSFVQLEATQWIQESWGKEDIVFDRAPDAPEDSSVDLSKPYILHSIEKRTADNKTRPIRNSRNYSLLSLGILLLELSTGQSFEQHLSRIKGKSTASLDPPEESVERLMKLSEVRKWLVAVQDDLSSGFHGAIWHCIKSYFDEESGKSEDVYRQAVLDQVVLPLQEDLQSFLGTRT
ncbi:hypothetical protein VC83_07938 [Pseudogymnoascus destructans]|uniref:DUF7580 domain-containing protein n=2 Tax=Pseudogymnoascus destructans TaxID=655981 RepID=L8GBS1_PSED2|nr:uncharacterized protein VC83_07938 [Pseudogymnoascus destructans]ELR10334.1 hypothetical protein GMDG_04716 [Pseudogymnoascus destructans 20631-21]OAF55994.1 hypothetical protein VC83_07938 [Pseudogymnoascus destructans]